MSKVKAGGRGKRRIRKNDVNPSSTKLKKPKKPAAKKD